MQNQILSSANLKEICKRRLVNEYKNYSFSILFFYKKLTIFILLLKSVYVYI